MITITICNYGFKKCDILLSDLGFFFFSILLVWLHQLHVECREGGLGVGMVDFILFDVSGSSHFIEKNMCFSFSKALDFKPNVMIQKAIY